MTQTDSQTDSQTEQLDPRVKVETDLSRLKSSVKLYFQTLEKVSKLHSVDEGALLVTLNFIDPDTGEIEVQGVSCWLPKKCCKNLDLDSHTVWIWDQMWDTKLEELSKSSYGLDFSCLETMLIDFEQDAENSWSDSKLGDDNDNDSADHFDFDDDIPF